MTEILYLVLILILLVANIVQYMKNRARKNKESTYNYDFHEVINGVAGVSAVLTQDIISRVFIKYEDGTADEVVIS